MPRKYAKYSTFRMLERKHIRKKPKYKVITIAELKINFQRIANFYNLPNANDLCRFRLKKISFFRICLFIWQLFVGQLWCRIVMRLIDYRVYFTNNKQKRRNITYFSWKNRLDFQQKILNISINFARNTNSKFNQMEIKFYNSR